MMESPTWLTCTNRRARVDRGERAWTVCVGGRRAWETWGGRDDTRGAMTDGIER